MARGRPLFLRANAPDRRASSHNQATKNHHDVTNVQPAWHAVLRCAPCLAWCSHLFLWRLLPVLRAARYHELHHLGLILADAVDAVLNTQPHTVTRLCGEDACKGLTEVCAHVPPLPPPPTRIAHTHKHTQCLQHNRARAYTHTNASASHALCVCGSDSAWAKKDGPLQHRHWGVERLGGALRPLRQRHNMDGLFFSWQSTITTVWQAGFELGTS